MTQDTDVPTGDAASGSGHAAAVEDYETLRAQVLGGATMDRPAGLVLLLRQGVAAWRARSVAAVSPAAPAARAAPPLRTHHRHAALVPVLVDMVLHTNPERHP